MESQGNVRGFQNCIREFRNFLWNFPGSVYILLFLLLFIFHRLWHIRHHFWLEGGPYLRSLQLVRFKMGRGFCRGGFYFVRKDLWIVREFNEIFRVVTPLRGYGIVDLQTDGNTWVGESLVWNRRIVGESFAAPAQTVQSFRRWEVWPALTLVMGQVAAQVPRGTSITRVYSSSFTFWREFSWKNRSDCRNLLTENSAR